MGEHRLKSGVQVVYNELEMKQLNLASLIPTAGDTTEPGFQFFDWDRALNSQERFQHNIYEGFPVEGALYLQDRIDYEGMILRCGLRMDWMDPGAASGEGRHKIWRERIKAVLSPRIGIAHPISERDALHFHYGRFYQIPHLSVLYEAGESLEDAPAGRIVGYSGLEPEVTTAYLFGRSTSSQRTWRWTSPVSTGTSTGFSRPRNTRAARPMAPCIRT